MDRSVLWRSALLQAGAVIVVSLALGLALPHSFFEDWGWISGPAAWLGCAALTARVLGLPTGSVLLGALLAGIPSALAVLAGAHWLGVIIAIALFALWCSRLAERGEPALARGGGAA
jgi:hypothetical protein